MKKEKIEWEEDSGQVKETILELFWPYLSSFKLGFYMIIIGFMIAGYAWEHTDENDDLIDDWRSVENLGFFTGLFGGLNIIIAFFNKLYIGSKWANKNIKRKIKERKEQIRLNHAEHIILTKANAKNFENKKEYDFALRTWIDLKKYEGNSEIYDEDINRLKILIEKEKDKGSRESAKERERALDYESAIEIWEKLGDIEEAARVRALKAEQSSVKVAQKVVHGDEVSKTEIKDSVLNRSNVGGGSSKMQELKDLTEMKEKGLIDDDEFKQMKKEILGK